MNTETLTPAEIADQLILDHLQPTFEKTFNDLRPKIDHDVVFQIVMRALNEKNNNANHASKIIDLAEFINTKIDSLEAQAITLFGRGKILEVQNNYTQAIELLQKSKQLYEQLDLPFLLAGVQLDMASVLRELGRYDEILHIAENARKIIEEHDKDHPYLVNVEFVKAIAYQRLGALDEASLRFEQVIKLAQQHERPQLEAETCNLYALTLLTKDRLTEAQYFFEQSHSIFIELEFQQEIHRLEMCLGELAQRQGRYQDALQFLELAQSGFETIGLPAEVGSVELLRSHVYRTLNLADELISTSLKANERLQSAELHYHRAQALVNCAFGYKNAGNYASASDFLNQARRIHREQNNVLLLIAVDIERAYLAFEERSFDQLKQITSELEQNPLIENLPLQMARLHLLLSQYHINYVPEQNFFQAKEHLTKALIISQEHSLKEQLISVRHLQGNLWEYLKAPLKAWEQYLKAISQVESIKNTLLLDDFQINFLIDKEQLYSDSLDLCHRLAYSQSLEPAELCFMINRSYSALLRHERIDKSPIDASSQKILSRLSKLRQEWQWLESKINLPSQNFDNNQIGRINIRERQQEIETEIVELTRRQQIKQISGQITTSPPQGDLLNSESSSWLQQIQSRLNKTNALLIYYLTGDVINAILITNCSIVPIDSLTTNPQIMRILNAWKLHIQNLNRESPRQLQRAQAYFHKLFNLLWAPLMSHLSEYATLYLVLPPIWHELPLNASFDGKNYVCEKFELIHLSTPDSILKRAEPLQLTQKTAVIMGNSDSQRLTHTLHEARQVTESLTKTWKTTLFLEEEVSVDNFRHVSQHSQIIHLATHAFFRPDNPYFSWVQLADAKFTVAELSEMSFPYRPLIVLSACETGKGIPRGGGLIGMGRSLLAAGASGVVLSLWPIEDEISAQFMRIFYQYLGQGLLVTKALTQARLEILNQVSHPFFWSGFIYMEG